MPTPIAVAERVRGQAVRDGGARHITLVRPAAVSPRFVYNLGIVPPLGMAYLAAALRAAGHGVSVIDAVGEAPMQPGPGGHPDLIAHGLTIEQIVDRIDPATDAVAVSVMFSQQWPYAAALIRAIHARLPDHPIFAGGEHVTAAPEFVLDSCPAVIACSLGEGEETIVELADHLAGAKRLGEIAGIAYREQGEVRRTPARARARDLDAIPLPAWDLFPIDAYQVGGFGHGVNLGRSMPILATRGCPYQCIFCSSPSMWTTRYYVRSVEDVVDEIASYVERYRATNIDFYDLTAIIKRDWILRFCDELTRRGLAITYQLPTGTRSEALDAEVLEALARTGCRNISYAPESGSLRTLRRIKKKVAPERILQSARTAASLGISVKANLMIGFPEETHRDLWETVRFGARLAWHGVEDIPLFPVSPYPGTELYRELRAAGSVPPMDDEYFARLSFSNVLSAKSLSRHLSNRELGLVRTFGMAFFLVLGYARRPARIVRTVRNLLSDRSTTVFEQRLLEIKLRALGVVRRAFSRALPRRRVRPCGEALTPLP